MIPSAPPANTAFVNAFNRQIGFATDFRSTLSSNTISNKLIFSDVTFSGNKVVKRQSDDMILSELPPIPRMKYFARNSPIQFTIWMVGTLGAIYITFRSLQNLSHYIVNFAGLYAFAQNGETVYGSTRDSFDWYAGLLMGITLLISQMLLVFSTSKDKITYGKDMSKLIVGFVVGFLSGKK